MSPHADWYVLEETLHDEAIRKKSIWFWKKDIYPPVTLTDQLWVERSLILLLGLFDPGYFRLLRTIVVDDISFGDDFKGTEADAICLFDQLLTIMDIDRNEVKLLFFTDEPEEISTEIIPTGKILSSKSGALGWYITTDTDEKEIWINLGKLRTAALLISVMTHELSHYKLLGEKRMPRNNELLTDLLAVVFGFGIFKGNSYFDFETWQSSSESGWRMKVNSYLPEQVMAYAMAWLAHYRGEDVNWKIHLNKTMNKYFEMSYEYIANNKDKVRWE